RIRKVTSRGPVGFRGPGFSCPPEVLSVLHRMGYAYDASVFPTSVAPLARWFFLLKSGLSGAKRDDAKELYGGFSSVFQPNRPFQRSIDPGDPGRLIWEVPVTVLPLARTPIHFSYLAYLGSFSLAAAKAYFRSTLSLCRMTGTPPSLLLHPTDFLGREDDTQLQYFPGMKMSRVGKLTLVGWALETLLDSYAVSTLADQVRSLDPDLPTIDRVVPEETPEDRMAVHA
ncbi:MAG: chitooligosaccharide deacetylase, partial [Planctomycetota bacterium]